MEVLLTGATGLLGFHVLKQLTSNKDYDRIHLLVRDVTRAKKLLEPLSLSISQMLFHEGDLTKKNLGLTTSTLQAFEQINQVFHCAANVTLSSSPAAEQELQETNVTGTKNLLDAFRNNKQVILYYVSTGYAAGITKNAVQEAWLPQPEQFRNPYEKSKWDAEQLINELHERQGTPFVIFRPTILLSDYKEDLLKLGNQTVYLYMNVLRKIIEKNTEEETIQLLGVADAPLNFVKLSQVTDVIAAVLKNNIKNKVFNIANPLTVNASLVAEVLQENLNNPVKFNFKSKLDKTSLSDTEAKIATITGAFSKYLLEQSPTWKTQNTDELIEQQNIVNEIWVRSHLKEYLNAGRQ